MKSSRNKRRLSLCCGRVRTDFEPNVAGLRMGLSGVTEQDVLRLQIAVHDPLVLQGPHGAG